MTRRISLLTLEMSREAKRESTYSTPMASPDGGAIGTCMSREVCTCGLRKGMQITVRRS